MKNSTKIALGAIGGVVSLAGITAYLIAPEKPDAGRKVAFYGRNFAHRGLHTKDRRVPENSLAAFKAAADAGYGIELDVRLTEDDHVAVFHDGDLTRMCGVKGRVEDLKLSELKKFRLFGTDERIPLLSEALAVVGGRVPLIVELKTCARKRELCERTLELLRCYSGPVCIESFDPTIVKFFRRKAPDILRGQLTSSARELKAEVSEPTATILSCVMCNFMSRPNFIAHGLSKKSLFVKIAEALGAMKVTWTAKNAGAQAHSDAVIFEHYEPSVRYK